MKQKSSDEAAARYWRNGFFVLLFVAVFAITTDMLAYDHLPTRYTQLNQKQAQQVAQTLQQCLQNARQVNMVGQVQFDSPDPLAVTNCRTQFPNN